MFSRRGTLGRSRLQMRWSDAEYEDAEELAL